MVGCHFEHQPEPRMASLCDGKNPVMSYYKFSNNFAKRSQRIHIPALRGILIVTEKADFTKLFGGKHELIYRSSIKIK